MTLFPSELSRSFKDAMAALSTPVSVITTLDRGQPAGATVSSLSSVSLDPPMILVCLDRSSNTLRAMRRYRRFGVSVLCREQADVARRFACKGGAEKFCNVTWDIEGGVPRIADTLAWLLCEVTDLIDAGDHVITVGTVLGAESAATAPLIYYSRRFASIE